MITYSFINEHPTIQNICKGLADCNEKTASKKLQKAFTTIKDLQDIDPHSKSRLDFILDVFQEVVDRNKGKPGCEFSKDILVESCNLKNALQMEAVLFGGMDASIVEYHTLLEHPYLVDLSKQFPDLLSRINPNSIFHDVIELDATDIVHYFDSVGYEALPNDFDTLMLKIFSGFKLEGNKLLIPKSSIPSKVYLEFFLKQQNLQTRLLAQLLYFCRIECDLISLQVTGRKFNEVVINIMTTLEDKPYLEKQKLIPILHHVVTHVRTFKGKAMSLEQMVFDRKFVKKTMEFITKDWIKISSGLYAFLKKIEIIARKVLPPAMKGSLDEIINSLGIDPHLLLFSRAMGDFVTSLKIKNVYPISDKKPFCMTKEEFELLPQSKFICETLRKNHDEMIANFLKSEKKGVNVFISEKKCVPHKKKKVGDKAFSPVASTESAAAADSASCPSIEETALLKESKQMTPIRSELVSSIEETKGILSQIKLHPRIQAWFSSKEAGMEYYASTKPAEDQFLEKDQMILRHHFPVAILSFAMNRLFSNRIEEQKDLKLMTLYKSIIYIDGVKHLLECVVNEHQEVFHLYAKPLKHMRNYFDLIRFSESEFPPLGHPNPKVDLEKMKLSVDGFHFDAQGNAVVDFDGRNLKIICLNTPSKQFD
jgi:hypothetical protein